MKEITNYQFHEAHLDFLELPEWFVKTDSGKERIANVIGSFTAFSIIFDGRLIAIYGFRHYVDKTFEVFVIPSIYLEDHPIKMMKHLKRCVETSFSSLPGRRFQSHSVDNERINRFMEFLGFLREGSHRLYNENGDTFNSWAYFTDGV